ncbi:MAG: ribonuclease Z [Chlamydiia bacterium]|nr:ribonuclease Z [Chlamydiia bacterium]
MTLRDLIILGTASQHPTRFRNHGAYLFRWRNEGMLFDPGEGTQRQFIFAEVAPTVVTRIFISHFHGDHCLGIGSMLMRLNLDNITHTVRCYYPASGERYFKKLISSTICNMNIKIEECKVYQSGVVDDHGDFIVKAEFLNHGNIDCIGWNVSEKSLRKFDKQTIKDFELTGPQIKEIINKGCIQHKDKEISLDDVSKIVEGDSIAVVLDTKYCRAAERIANNASLLLCESTYLKDEQSIAKKHKHLTSIDAANIAKKAKVSKLVLTHFSARHVRESLFQKDAQEVFKNSIAAKDLMRISIPKTR